MVNNIHFWLAGRKREHRTIGFFGADAGVGTTHLALAAASFAVAERGIPAAVVELSDKPCIAALDAKPGERDFFTADGVGYYPRASFERMPELLHGPYPYLMLDLGCKAEGWQEFLRCDLRYIVASLSLWRIGQAENFMNIHNQSLHYFTALLTITGNIYEKKNFQRKYHVPVRTIPFIADPFWSGKAQLSFFQELL